MRHEESGIGQNTEVRNLHTSGKNVVPDDFVLEKNIFNNIFEKDIRRVFVYKKAERLAKGLHLISPAFTSSVSLKNRFDAIAIALIDAAILPPHTARIALSRELLALSSMLGIVRTGGLLSMMNADLVAREAQMLLQEVAAYEEPRLQLEESPTLSSIASIAKQALPRESKVSATPRADKGHLIKNIEDILDSRIKDRRETVMSVIRSKGTVGIKDISTLVLGVSEKTIQRELSALVALGALKKQGERRWSTYSLA